MIDMHVECFPSFQQDMFNDTDHCDTQAVLDCFRALYDFYPNLTATDKNTVGVGEYSFSSLVRPDRSDHSFVQWSLPTRR